CLPESNVEEVVRDLALKTMDFDGSGLVKVFRVLLDRAIEYQRTLARCKSASEAMLTGQAAITKETVTANALDSIFETRCLRLFLATACKKLADDLEFEILEKQRRLPRLKSVVFSAEGEVEAFQVERA